MLSGDPISGLQQVIVPEFLPEDQGHIEVQEHVTFEEIRKDVGSEQSEPSEVKTAEPSYEEIVLDPSSGDFSFDHQDSDFEEGEQGSAKLFVHNETDISQGALLGGVLQADIIPI